jgi:hypothetical protein
VNAHIRHVYTDYEKLLKGGMEWIDARKAVGSACIKKLREWRGEDGKVEVEEAFQEWIDLRDDDDDDDDEDDEESEMDSPYGSDRQGPPSHHRMPVVHEGPFEEILRPLPLPPHHRAHSVEMTGIRPRVRYIADQQYEPVYPSVERSPPSPYTPRHSTLPHPPNSRAIQPQPHKGLQYGQVDRAPHEAAAYFPSQSYGTTGRADDYPMRVNGRLTPGSKEMHAEIIDLTSSPRTVRNQEPSRLVSQRHSYPQRLGHGEVPRLDGSHQLVASDRGIDGTRRIPPRQEHAGGVSQPAHVSSVNYPGSHRRVLSSGAPREDRTPIHRNAYRAVPDFAEHAFMGATGPVPRPDREEVAFAHAAHRSVAPPHPVVPTTGWVSFKDTQRRPLVPR